MAQIDDIIAVHMEREGPLLPILQDVQAAFGHVPQEAVCAIAQALNLSRAEVHGVVSFYHGFRSEPEPRKVVKLCRAESCQARGVDALVRDLPDMPGVKIETVYCLGLCSVGPNAMIGDTLHARLDAARLGALMAELA
jgi:formate dehydrogenase subunit gamma